MRSSAISIENRTFASSFDGDQYHYICICKLRIRCLGHLSMFSASKIQPTSKWSFQIFCIFNPTWGEIQCNLTFAYFSNGLVQPTTRHGHFWCLFPQGHAFRCGRARCMVPQPSSGSRDPILHGSCLLRLRSGRSSPQSSTLTRTFPGR